VRFFSMAEVSAFAGEVSIWRPAFQLQDQQYWTIAQMEFSGGNPHGVYVSGTRGVLRGIHLRDIAVHGVTGAPKTKEGGLVVIAAGSGEQRFEDVVVDGVTAYGTTQWAGILVGSVNQDTLLEENYGHDTQGYCVGIFGSGWVTGNSVARNNTCADNVRSPRLAISQGAIYLSTSNHGTVKDVEISGNRIFWNPPAAAFFLVNNAEIVGKGSFENNVIRSAAPLALPTGSPLVVKGNSVEPYRGRITNRTAVPETVPAFALRDAGGKIASSRNPGQWTLLAWVAVGEGENDSRGQIALIESVHRQFPHLAVKIVVSRMTASDPESRENLRYDWNTCDLPVLFDDGSAARALRLDRAPSVVLLDPEGRLMWRYRNLTPPAELGLALRDFIGSPNYAELVPEK
jgi:hypothetical protein